jgi:AcrR family transcriptional regulator
VNRRERVREATVQEIKQAAYSQLIAGGPASISLRAIARDLGMTAAALYRYFPGLDALVEELAADSYDRLTESIIKLRDAESEPKAQLLASARGFRTWAVANKQEFTLMFGSPLPGVMDFDAACRVHTSGVAFSTLFAEAFMALWVTRSNDPTDPQTTAAVTESLDGPLLSWLEGVMPPEAVAYYISGWVKLYGIVAMEIFGHLSWAVTDVSPLFEAELTEYVNRLAP